MYISLPSIYIPVVNTKENKPEIMSVYENISKKLKNKPQYENDKNVIAPRAILESEEFATIPIQKLSNYIAKQPVSYIADCRSSSSANVPASSYKLLALNSLESTIPFCIQHQGGIELISGLVFLESLINENKQVLLTTIQRFYNIEDRIKQNGYILADATSAMLLSKQSNIYDEQFQLLSTNIFQNVEININFQNILINYLTLNNLSIKNIDWCIVHNYSKKITVSLNNLFPELNILSREIFSTLDFGVSDIPISLNLLHKKLKKNTGNIKL